VVLTGNEGSLSEVCLGNRGLLAASNDGGRWADAALLDDGGVVIVTEAGDIVAGTQLVHQVPANAGTSSTFTIRRLGNRVWATSCSNDGSGAISILFDDGGIADFNLGMCVGAIVLTTPDDAWIADGYFPGALVHFTSQGTEDQFFNATPMRTSAMVLTSTSLFVGGSTGNFMVNTPTVVQYHLQGH
jgi:hypothetical protein